MTVRLLPPGWQQTDANGNPVSGALLYTYEPGTTTPKTTYSDAALTIANANPVVANSAGVFGPVFAAVGQYRLLMTTPTAAVLWDADPVDGGEESPVISTLDNVEPVLFNSTFNVWQRGTSVAIAGGAFLVTDIYGPDGWAMETGAGQACTISRQAGITTDALYCARFQRDSGQTGTATMIPQQWIPTTTIAQLRGKRVTFSFDIRVGATFSGVLTAVVRCGTGAEGRRPRTTPYTSETLVLNSAPLAITTSTQRFTFSSGAVVPADATQMAVIFNWTPSGTAGATDYFEIGRPVFAPFPGIDPPVVTETYELQRAHRWYRVIPAGLRYAGYTAAGGTVAVGLDYAPMRATPGATGTASVSANVATGPSLTPSTDRTEITATATATAVTTFTMNAITLDARL